MVVRGGCAARGWMYNASDERAGDSIARWRRKKDEGCDGIWCVGVHGPAVFAAQAND